jgi:hypothetical protein
MKNFGLVAKLMQDKNNQFMVNQEEQPAIGLVKKDVEIEEYPESMKIKYENVMPSGWL